MGLARRVPLRLWRVRSVVRGEVEVVHVQQGEPSVELELTELKVEVGLERSQVCLVVRVVERGPAQGCESGSDPGGGEVLDQAVVLVAPSALAHQRQGEVTDRAQSRVHVERG